MTSAIDPLFITWTLAWDVHALSTNPAGLFDANILYPMDRTLAFSDHLLGFLPIFWPIQAVAHNLVAAYNISLLFCYALAALFATALAFSWTRAWAPSILAGLFFGFAPVRFADLQHLQILAFFWAPLALLFLKRVLERGHWGDTLVFTLLFCLQAASAVYLAYFITLAVALHVLLWPRFHRVLLSAEVLPKALFFLGASGLVLLPLHWPYLQVHRAWGASRDLREIVENSPDLLSFLAAPAPMPFGGVFRPDPGSPKTLFPGFLLPLLALVGAWRTTEPRLRRVFVPLTLLAALLALGPYLRVAGRWTDWPMPYLLLYKLIPGWEGMRAPGRLVHLATLGGSILAAAGAVELGQRTSRPRLLWAALGGAFLLELGWAPERLVPVPSGEDIPPAYAWLAKERPGPMVELPFGRLPDFRATLLSTVHWLPLVNGRTGFYPPETIEIQRALSSLPSPEAFAYAEALGLRAILVHTDKLTASDREAWQEAEAAGRVRWLARFGQDTIANVAPAPLAGTPGAQLRVHPRLALELTAPADSAWRRAPPYGRSRVRLHWAGGAPEQAEQTEALALLPVVLRPGQTLAVPLREVQLPSFHALRVEAELPDLGIRAPARALD